MIALVPTRDEASTIRRYLEATLSWADAVIVCDQSADGTADIARSFAGVTVIEEPPGEYDEQARQLLLIDEARRLVPGRRFLVALDADELLSANVLESEAWERAVRSPPGTRVQIGLVELCQEPSRYLIDWGADRGRRVTFAYADDGRPHHSRHFHASRLPEPPDSPQTVLEDVVVLHFATGNPVRVASKDRWYQCQERMTVAMPDPVAIRRRYDWRRRLAPTFDVRPCPDEWFAGYRKRDVDLSERPGADVFWTDWGVLRMFAAHGVAPFALLDIWDPDWEAMRQRGKDEGVQGLPDWPVVRPDAGGQRLLRGLLRTAEGRRGQRFIDALVRRAARLGWSG